MENIHSKIINKYKITYSCGIVQYKNLISHSDYNDIMKPMKEQIHLLEKENNNKPTLESLSIKRQMKSYFSDNWFTDESPLFDAIKTNKLILLIQQGNVHDIKVELVV